MSSFYCLVLKSHCEHKETVARSFRITGITLNKGSHVKLYLTQNNRPRRRVAILNSDNDQRSLYLTFKKGDEITFELIGMGEICLLGFTMPLSLENIAAKDEQGKPPVATGENHDNENNENWNENANNSDDTEPAIIIKAFKVKKTGGENHTVEPVCDEDLAVWIMKNK